MRRGAFFTGIACLLASSANALALDALCRNDEKCFGIGANLASQPDLQHSVGRWPLPRTAKMTAAAGDTIHFEWDSRNEYFNDAQKIWVKGASGLTTSWELAGKGVDPKSKDPCTGEDPGPWKAQSPVGSFDWPLKDCAIGHTFRIKIRADKINPITPEAALEITVVKGSKPHAQPFATSPAP